MAKRKVSNRKSWSPGHRSQQRIFEETFVYLMTNIPFFMVNKFGITDKQAARRKTVSVTTPGLVKTVLSVNLAFGYDVEQFVHGLYKLQNVHFWTGSGRTEWFIVFSPIVGCAALWANNRFGLDMTIKQLGLCFFTPFIWWDGIFWLLLFRAMKLIFVAAAFFLCLYAVAHIK